MLSMRKYASEAKEGLLASKSALSVVLKGEVRVDCLACAMVVSKMRRSIDRIIYDISSPYS